MKTFAQIICLIAMAACTPRDELPPTPQQAAKQASRDYERHTYASNLKPRVLSDASDGRFKVERVQTFDDGSAYSNSRAVYVITDTKTGQEFVGVSGVGIAELGSHRSGKASVSDER